MSVDMGVDQAIPIEGSLNEEPETPTPIWYVPPSAVERPDRLAKTVNMRRITKRQLQVWREEVDPDAALLLADRPRTRGDCVGGERPCPYVGCKHHLYLDVNEDTGSVTFNFPGKEPDELEHSCALDVADEGGATLEVVGEFFQVTRERIRQIESKVLAKLKKNKTARAVFEAGGFDETYESPLGAAMEGGGGTVTSTPEKSEEEEIAEDFSARVARIYERTSRERTQGIRPEYRLTLKEEVPSEASDRLSSFLAPVLEKPVEITAEEAAMPPLKEESMSKKQRPVKVHELTEREAEVLKAYSQFAQKLERRPSPLSIARQIGLKGPNSAVSASVCTALASIRRKGNELPFYDVRTPKEERTPAKIVYPSDSSVPETASVSSTEVASPEKQSASDAPSDAVRDMLLREKEKLQKKLAAIEVLLTA